MADGVVEKLLDEDALDRGAIRLTAREAGLLGLGDHRAEPLVHFDGDVFHAQWAPSDSELRGELLTETLQLNGTVGGLARLITRDDGLELSLTARDQFRQTRLVDVDAAPVAPRRAVAPSEAKARKRPAQRNVRADRYRLRERGEYVWNDGVGLHRPSLERLRQNIDDGGWDSPELFELRVTGEKIGAVNSFEELMAVDHAKVDHMPHQEATARRVLSRMQGRGILADEVGLGKTVEAGLIMKELILRGMAERILIVCPASLRDQWKDELETKFDETFEVATTSGKVLSSDRLITSLALARAKHNRPQVTKKPWDLVIWDEAHKGSGAGATTTKAFWEAIDTRYLLFLTATPVQNDLLELYRLVNMLRPGTFRSKAEFENRFLDKGNKREPRNPADLRRLVSDVMVRTTREQAGVDRIQRHAADVAVRLSPAERDMYRLCTDGLRTVLAGPNDHLRRRQLAQRLTSAPRSLARTAERMAKQEAISADARRFLNDLADFAIDGGLTSRQRELLGLIEAWTTDKDKGQVIVFTQHNDTVQDLARILGDHDVDPLVFHGGLSSTKRQEIITCFTKHKAPVLLSTDAGAEGLNLQSSNCVVNYDLPWNPMRIEQRIGRVHRLTQTRDDVYVANLYALGTVDEHVYRILHDKLRMFELLFGQVTTILGELSDSDRSFEHIVMDALVARDDTEMLARLDKLGEQVDDAWQSTRAMIGDEGGLNAWIADNSHREHLPADARELTPEITASRNRKRQDKVRAFVRKYVQTLGLEVTDQVLADNEGRGAFLSCVVPEHLVDDLGGRGELNLVFDSKGLEDHRGAELCAAGTEVFELLVLSLSEHGDLMAAMPPDPDIPDDHDLRHSETIRRVDRRVLGPETWDGEAVWRVRTDTDDGGDEVLRIPIGDTIPKRLTGLEVLTSHGSLPESLADTGAVESRAVEGSRERLAQAQAKAQRTLDRLAQAEKARMVAHFTEQVDDLSAELARARDATRKTDLKRRLRQVERALEQQAAQRAATAEVRADLIALRMVGRSDFVVEETWRRGDVVGTVRAVWSNGTLTARDATGTPIDVLDLCRDGHPNDHATLRACSSCDQPSCPSCQGPSALGECVWCASAVCRGCAPDGFCRSCAHPERDAGSDRDGLVGWRVGGDGTLLVGTGMAVVTRDGSETVLVDRLDTDQDRSRVALAASLGARLDMGTRTSTLSMFPEHPGLVALGRSKTLQWQFEPDTDGGHAPLPEWVTTGLAPVDAERTRDHPLADVIAGLRRQEPPAPAGCLVADEVAVSHAIGVDDTGLVASRAEATVEGEVVRRSSIRLERIDGAGFSATADVFRHTLTVTRINASYDVTLTGRDGHATRWFVAGGDGVTEGSERAVAAAAAAQLGVGTDTIVAVDELGDEPTPLPSVPNERVPTLRVLSRGLDVRYRLTDHARRPFREHDLAALGVAPEATTARTVDADVRVALHAALVAADEHRPTPRGLHRSWMLRETWAKGEIMVDRERREILPGEAAWPVLDDTGEPGASIDICDRGHLHEAEHDWHCVSCDEQLCRACGPDGELDTCGTCERVTCERCRSGTHVVETTRCEWCDDASCASCGTVVDFGACRTCGQVMCVACLSDDRCRMCLALHAAEPDELRSLPAHLAAHGMDVAVSAGRRRTIVTIVGHERREFAVVEGDDVVEWFSVVDESEASRLLRIAAALRCRSTGDVSLVDEDADVDAPTTADWVLADASVDTVAWELSVHGTRSSRGTIKRPHGDGALDPGDERVVLAANIGREDVPEAAPADRAAALDALIPAFREQPAAQMRIRRTVYVNRVVLDTDGIVHVEGEVGRETRSADAWMPLEVQEWPAPTYAARATSGVHTATIRAWGPIVALTVDGPDGTSSYRLDRGEHSLEAVRLAAWLDRSGAVELSEAVDPAAVRGLTVRNAVSVATDWEWVVTASTSPADPGLLQQLTPLLDEAGETLPASLASARPAPLAGRRLLAVVPARARSVNVVSLELAVTEEWSSGVQTATTSDRLTQESTQARVVAFDTGARVSEVSLDDAGHLVEQLMACDRCAVRACRRCSDAIVRCELCDSWVCTRCRGGRSSRCPACATLQPIGRLRQRRRYPDLRDVVVGVSDGWMVVFGRRKDGVVVRSVSPADAQDPELIPVPVTAAQAALLAREFDGA